MKIDEKKPNILIPNIPEDKIKNLETILKPILKGLNIETEIMTAPYSMMQVLKQYETLYAEMRRIGNQLSALKGTGFQVGTENMEKILKLNMQHLVGAVKTMKEEISKKLNEIIETTKIKRAVRKELAAKLEKPDLLKIEYNIRTKLKIEGKRTPKTLATIALSDKPLSTKELAKKIYGKDTELEMGYVGRLLKQFVGKLIDAKRRKDRMLDYSWKDKKILKKLME